MKAPPCGGRPLLDFAPCLPCALALTFAFVTVPFAFDFTGEEEGSSATKTAAFDFCAFSSPSALFSDLPSSD